MVRALVMVFFTSSAITAFCLATMTTMFMTGELPFGLQSMAAYLQKAPPKKQNQSSSVVQNFAAEDKYLVPERANEKILNEFYNTLKAQRSELEQEKKDFEQEKKSLKQIAERFKILKEELVKKQQKVVDLLELVTKEEQANVEKLSKVIVTMETVDAVKFLMQQSDKMVARILYLMNEKKAGVFIAAIINHEDDNVRKRMKNIFKIIHKLTLKDLKQGA